MTLRYLGSSKLPMDSAATLLSTLLGRASMLLLQVLIARRLGAEDFNLFVTASVIGLLVLTISDFGCTQAITFVARGDTAIGRGLLVSLARMRVLAFVLAIGVGFLALRIIAPSASRTQIVGSTLIVLAYAILSVSRYLRSPLLVEGRVSRQAWLEGEDRLFAVVGGTVGLLLGSLWYVAIGQVGGALIGAARSLRIAAGERRQVLLDRSIVRYGLALSGAVVATQVYGRLDYLIVSKFEPPEVSASYAAIYVLVISAKLILLALATTATAQFARDPVASRKTYTRSTMAVGFIAGAGLASLGPSIARILFHVDANDLPLVCVVLGMAFVLMAYNSTLGVTAPLLGSEKALLSVVWSAVVVSAVLGLVLIPAMGIVGGAASALATELFILFAYRLSRRHKDPCGPMAPPRVVDHEEPCPRVRK